MNLTLDGKKALKTLSAANKRLNTTYVFKESFGQLWSYEREGWPTLLRELAREPQVAAARRHGRRLAAAMVGQAGRGVDERESDDGRQRQRDSGPIVRSRRGGHDGAAFLLYDPTDRLEAVGAD